MFEKLQKKWKVKGWQLTLILFTFAIGGSLCGFLGKKVMSFLGLEVTGWTIPLYILVVTILWPLCVIAISIPFGQFRFFSNYLNKMGRRLGIIKKSSPSEDEKVHLAIFASGSGSNALKLMEHFQSHPQIHITLLISNRSHAGALQHAANHHIETLIIEKERFFRGDHYLPELKAKGIDFIVLAGFLWKIPAGLIKAYPQKIVNLHPALLPKYGGKGMYGRHVHEAVLGNGETESGITIHFVDEHYDHGAIIFQAMCPVEKTDSPDSLAEKIHALEHKHLPKVVEQVVRDTMGL